MLQILFQLAKFVYQSRYQTDLVVKWGGESGSGSSTVRINFPGFLVDLLRTTKGNGHLLATNDHFSKLIKLYAIKDRKASTPSACPQNFILTHGIPLKTLTDQDPSVESK